MNIGVLGGTGPAGSSLVARLALAGHQTIIGSRSPERAEEKKDEILARWPDKSLDISAGDNQTCSLANVVVVATPWDASAETVLTNKDSLKDKVIISMCNALAKVGDEFQPLVPPRGSVAASIQAALPDSMVSAALHHIPAKELGDLNMPVDSDVLVCSDHPQATKLTSEIVDSMPSLYSIDAGNLSNAAPIEAFAAVLLAVNIRYKTRVALRFTNMKR